MSSSGLVITFYYPHRGSIPESVIITNLGIAITNLGIGNHYYPIGAAVVVVRVVVVVMLL